MNSWRMVRAAAVVVALLAVPLVTASVEDGWREAEITAGKQPIRYAVRKTGWRGGRQLLLVDDPDEVRNLYTRLAGNSRVGYTCGFHWDILFEYHDAPAESIAINERCETFRREPAETWQAVKAAFTRARTEPTHFFVILSARDPHAGARLRKLLEPQFGTVIDSSFPGTFLLASPQQWPDARLAALRKTCGRAVTVVVPQEYDTGS